MNRNLCFGDKQASKQKNKTKTKKHKTLVGWHEIIDYLICAAIAHAQIPSTVRVCMSMYRMEENKTLLMALNLSISVSARARAQLLNLHCTTTHLRVPNGGSN